MVASVVISALIFSRAITKPFSKPVSIPRIKPATTPIHRLSVLLITTAVVTPAQAITEATDKSKSPEAKQNNMPQETIPDREIARPKPLILIKLEKLGTNMVQTINSRTNTTSMPKSSHMRDKLIFFFAFGEEVVTVDIFDSFTFRQPHQRGWYGLYVTSPGSGLSAQSLPSVKVHQRLRLTHHYDSV